MSVVTRVPLEKDTGVCLLVCRGAPATLGLIAPVGSLALNVTLPGLYQSTSATTSAWTAIV